MTGLRNLLVLLLLALGGLLPLAPAQAATFTFVVKSEYPYQVRLEFRSADRGVYWPGNGKSWLLDDSETHRYNLTCTYGEQICYGAWEVNGTLQWGIGYQYTQGCKNCCFTCTNGGQSRLIRLTP